MKTIVALVAAAAAPFASVASLAPSALAQETSPVVLRSVQGAVYVMSDGGVAPARAGAALAPGDRVLTLSGGHADLAAGDGCNLALTPGASATVQSEVGCAGRLQQADSGYIAADYLMQPGPDAGAPVGPAGAAGAGVPAGAATSGTVFGMSYGAAALAGVGLAGIAAGAAVAFSGTADGHDQPTSA